MMKRFITHLSFLVSLVILPSAWTDQTLIMTSICNNCLYKTLLNTSHVTSDTNNFASTYNYRLISVPKPTINLNALYIYIYIYIYTSIDYK
jgi:hypothetical protein